MRSRSSSSDDRLTAIGRVSGHRGGDGELTVRIRAGEAARWTALERVWLDDGRREPRPFVVGASRAYRDRLVLALEGIGDPSAAAGLRGMTVRVADDDRPELAAGEWQPEDLEGMNVIDERGATVGRALGVMRTGGVDLLRVQADDELLLPLVEDYVVEVRPLERTIVARVPDDLRELNRPGA